MPKNKKIKLAKGYSLGKNQLILLLAAVAAVGGFLVYRSFAAVAPQSVTWQESGTTSRCREMKTVCNHGGSVVSDSKASGGKAYRGTSTPYDWHWYGPYWQWNVSKDRQAGYTYYYVRFYVRNYNGNVAIPLYADVISNNGSGRRYLARMTQSPYCNANDNADYKELRVTINIRTGAVQVKCPNGYVSPRGSTSLSAIEKNVEFRFYGHVNVDRVVWTKS